MATLYKKPRIATLIHKQTPYRGEWVIYQYRNHNYGTCHELEQSHGERKVPTSALRIVAIDGT